MPVRSVPAPTERALSTWAAQKRSLFLTTSEPLPSVLGRIKTQRVAAGEGDPRMRQKWPEVYTGDGLIVQKIILTLHELPRLTLTYYYVLRAPWRVPIKVQAYELGIQVRNYWRNLEIAEAAVDTGLQLLTEQRAA